MTKIGSATASPVYYNKVNGKTYTEKEFAAELQKAMKDEAEDEFEKTETEKETPKKKKFDMTKLIWVGMASIAGGAVAMKFMPIARRFATKVIGGLLEKGVKYAGKFGEKHPKLAFDTEKVLNKIGAVKKELIEGNQTKYYDMVKNNLQDILGIEIKTKSPVLAGIKNDVGFIDAAAASLIGFNTTGKAAMNDDKEITKADIADKAGQFILIAS